MDASEQATARDGGTADAAGRSAPRLRVLGRDYAMPDSRPLRVAIGVALVLGGLLGFLPVLGFWMVPLGLLVLSHDFAPVRRFRRTSQTRIERWRRARARRRRA